MEKRTTILMEFIKTHKRIKIICKDIKHANSFYETVCPDSPVVFMPCDANAKCDMIVNLMDDVVDAHQKTEGEAYMDIDSPSGTKVTVSEQSIRNGSDTYKIRANQHLKVGGVYTVDRTEIHNWYTEVILYEFPGVRFSSVQFVKIEDVVHISYEKIKHLKHMDSAGINGGFITRIDDHFRMIDVHGYEYISDRTVGTSVTVAFIAVKTAPVKTERINPCDTPSVEAQMKHAELTGELPDYIVHKTTIDFEKVIEDLLTIVKEYSPHRGPTEYMYRSEIQNAEAALGMLHAFKKERGHIGADLKITSGPYEVPKVKVPHAPKESTQFQIHDNERHILVDDISKMLPVDPAKTVGSIPEHIVTANAIVFAIERYEQLKQKNR